MHVLQRKTVGAYDTTVLSATDAPALRAWLSENGFDAPESIDPVVTELMDEGWVFVASKVRAPAEHGVVRLHPLAFTFATPEPVYPMRLTGVGATTLALELYVCGAGRALAEGMDVSFCATADRFSGLSDELSLRVGNAGVLTKLVGDFDAASMARDIVLGWEAYEGAATVYLGPRAAFHRAAGQGGTAALALLIVAGLVGRRLAGRGGRHAWLVDVLAPFVALGCAALVGILVHRSLPTVPGTVRTVDRGRSGPRAVALEPPDSVRGDPDGVREWMRDATSDHVNPYTDARMREEDSPGNWWLRSDAGRLEVILWLWPHRTETVDASGLIEVEGTVRSASGEAVVGGAGPRRPRRREYGPHPRPTRAAAALDGDECRGALLAAPAGRSRLGSHRGSRRSALGAGRRCGGVDWRGRCRPAQIRCSLGTGRRRCWAGRPWGGGRRVHREPIRHARRPVRDGRCRRPLPGRRAGCRHRGVGDRPARA